MKNFFDDDIAAMKLSEIEKNGLQIYRNYSKSFRSHSIKKFIEEIDGNAIATDGFSAFSEHLGKQSERDIAISVTAYADDLLEMAFRANLPDDVPGGVSRLIDQFGPVGDLSKRISIAYCLRWISRPSAKNIDIFRRIRNRYAHSWTADEKTKMKLASLVKELDPIETIIADDLTARAPRKRFPANLSDLQKIRVRALMTIGLLESELAILPIATRRGFLPREILYGVQQPKHFKEISLIALRRSMRAIGSRRKL